MGGRRRALCMRYGGLTTMAALLGALALTLALGACGVTAGTGVPGTAAGGSVSYDQAAGHIIVQLFPQPGFVFPPFDGMPQWTLYGDGTLIYANGGGPALAPGSSTLMEAKLTPDQIEQILGVVVTQHHVFATTKGPYGHMMPDVGTMQLIVNANGQHAQVDLSGSEGLNPTTQTRDVFAIEQYLLSYKPANSRVYAAPGVAVLVLPVATGAADSTVPGAWPYADVDLAQAQARECLYVEAGNGCSGRMNGAPGILAIYGQRGQSLLTQFGRGAVVTQTGKIYRILLWPLLPDATQTSAGTPPALHVVSGGSVRSWPLYSA